MSVLKYLTIWHDWLGYGSDPSVSPGSTQARRLIFLLSRFHSCRHPPPVATAISRGLLPGSGPGAAHRTQEQLVIYPVEQDGQVYARLVAMFVEWIEHQGQSGEPLHAGGLEASLAT